MGKPAARVGDMHTCPMFDGKSPHVGGPVMPPGLPTVLIGGMPAATLGNMCTCAGPPDVIVMGSTGVMIGGKPAARMGDSTAHGGVIVAGFPTVLMGEIAGGSVFVISQPITFGVGFVKFGKIIIQEDPSDPGFHGRVLADLILIDYTPSGRQMLNSLNSGGGASIISTDEGNSHRGGVVSYNAYRGNSGGIEPWSTRPPAIGLAHELIHADHTVNGNRGTGFAPNDSAPNPDPRSSSPPLARVEELNTTGIPPHDKRPYSENSIRSEWPDPQPQRLWY